MFSLIYTGHAVEQRLEEALAQVGLSLAKFGALTHLVEAGEPISLSEEMRKSLARPETQERMRALGAVTVADTPAEFAAFLRKDHERWARVIKASGVKAE